LAEILFCDIRVQLVLVFLFQKVVPLKIEAYPAFIFAALLPWNWFTVSLNSAGGLFIGNRDMVRRPNFPLSTLIIVEMLSNLLIYLIFMPVLFVILILYSRHITLSLLILPLLLLIQGILIVGLGLIVATLNVFYRDIQYIVSVAVMLLFYLTPVFYRPQAVGESYRYLYILNPLAVLVQSYRSIFFYGKFPEWGSLLLTGIISTIVLGIGYFIYNRQLHNIFDAI
jgi:lipopolysaccharide transport system permease protein